MKKTLILVMAAMATMGCAKKYNAQDVIMVNQNDSVNYAIGLMWGQDIKMQFFAMDSTDAPITIFMTALEKAYDAKGVEESEALVFGKNLGASIKMFEKEGLASNPAWTVNEQILLQGLVNGIYGDTMMIQSEAAYNIVSQAYQASTTDPISTDKAVKAKKAPKEVYSFDLNSKMDTLNYAIGVIQGSRLSMIIAQDTTGENFKDLIKGINAALKDNSGYPMLSLAGEQICSTIHTWEESGLINEPSLTVDVELIKQGLVNGMYQYGEWSIQEASMYVNQVMTEVRFGAQKIEGEEFLDENKTKEGVMVTESGLQYEVIKMGKGKKPAVTDRVQVHYHGTLIDGTVFDSSVERGEPTSFGLNQVIAGWTEGLQLMPVGSKFRFYIPQELGYGERQAGAIPPYSVLIFEVELLKIEK